MNLFSPPGAHGSACVIFLGFNPGDHYRPTFNFQEPRFEEYPKSLARIFHEESARAPETAARVPTPELRSQESALSTQQSGARHWRPINRHSWTGRPSSQSATLDS